MSFLDTLRKSLTPEMYTQVTDALGDDFDFDLVPRSRLNKVIKQRNDLREQLAGKSQPQSKQDPDPDEDDPPAPTPAQPPVDVKELEKQWQAKQDQAVRDVKIQYAVLEKLRAANAIDAELMLNGGLIDRSKLALDESGKLTGADEIITQLQKDKAHLFSKPGGAPPGTGKEGGADPKGVATREDFLKLTAEQQIAFKQSNPTMFQKFLEQ